MGAAESVVTIQSRDCSHCGRPYPVTRADREYCSQRCVNGAHVSRIRRQSAAYERLVRSGRINAGEGMEGA